MRLIKDMCLYGTYPRPQTFGHLMDARPARASWLNRLAFTATSVDDLSETRSSCMIWPSFLQRYLDSTYFPAGQGQVHGTPRLLSACA